MNLLARLAAFDYKAKIARSGGVALGIRCTNADDSTAVRDIIRDQLQIKPAEILVGSGPQGVLPQRGATLVYTEPACYELARALGLKAADSPTVWRLLLEVSYDDFGEDLRKVFVKCKSCFRQQELDAAALETILYTGFVKGECGCRLTDRLIQVIEIHRYSFDSQEPLREIWPPASTP